MDITVIVPVYKGQKYINPIQEMVEKNILYAKDNGQPLSVELLFVNDFPADPIVVDKRGDNYRIETFFNPKNCGIHQTRVNGLKKATGNYILFLDQDDTITSNCLYSQYMSIGENDIVIGNGYRKVNDCYRKIYKSTKKQKLSCKEIIYLKAANQIVSPGHCLIRKEAIPSEWCNNCMTDNGSDDLLLWLIMFEKGKKFCVNHECVYKHVDTGINFSDNINAMFQSSENLISIAEKNQLLQEKSISLYKRRIKYLKNMQNASILKKISLTISNLDICLMKAYAYYR